MNGAGQQSVVLLLAQQPVSRQLNSHWAQASDFFCTGVIVAEASSRNDRSALRAQICTAIRMKSTSTPARSSSVYILSLCVCPVGDSGLLRALPGTAHTRHGPQPTPRESAVTTTPASWCARESRAATCQSAVGPRRCERVSCRTVTIINGTINYRAQGSGLAYLL